jgi:hypothetical protein
MSVMFDIAADPQLEWLYHVGPVGLVIGPNIIREDELVPPRQSTVETEAVDALLSKIDGKIDLDGPALTDPWAFLERILGWEAQYVAGAPGGPELPHHDLATMVPEHDLTLSPDWAVRDLSGASAPAPNGGATSPLPYQVLVKLHPDVNAEARSALPGGWQASAHQQFERLLRDTGIPIGVLVDRTHLWLIYAPKGETSGWLKFPLRSLATVAGRPMLAGLKLMLGHARLFTSPGKLSLPSLLARSREAQNKVSAELAEQVLGALHELLRAFHAADPQRVAALAKSDPHHLYEGLLTTLMRLVFLLYAEDRELMPTQRTGAAVEVYEQGYSVRGLFARLVEDRALHPDTMDERVGGWGRLLALFRLVHGGHGAWITARGGKLFDPDAFPFLEGRDRGEPREAPQVLPIKDGAILRILEGLMTIEAKSVTGEKVRERLSYRSLDVEQIGSVYEIVMGFKVELATGPMIAVKGEKNLPVFVDIAALENETGAGRQKLLKELGVAPTGRRLDAIKRAGSAQELTEALAAICDPRGSPGGHVTPAGSPVLQPTDERRRTGSHYTPRSLTEPIVRHALEPAFDRLGPDATPEQILDLKVCDPAMGSGAFLVEACRALAARLVKAWERWPEKRPAIPADEDEDLHARRLVAQRCLYGVDKNPLATDLAKLSLWLATLAREHEFTFLDHALKSGDSLVGLTRAQIAAANWDASKPGLPLFRQLVSDRVAEVTKGRAEIRAAPDDIARTIQEARHRKLEDRIKDVRIIGDAVIAAFSAEEKPRARETKRAEVESWLSASPVGWDKLVAMATTLKHCAHPLRPFHWEIEFPEVFERANRGFDALIGNPPFLGGARIWPTFGGPYTAWLKQVHEKSGGKAVDLVAHFFRRANDLISAVGTFGLIATNTIAQGDTRAAGLKQICGSDSRIIRAQRRLKWPGSAAVLVSVIHISRNPTHDGAILDGESVRGINSYLLPYSEEFEASILRENKGRCFRGCDTYGTGFIFSPESDPELAGNIEEMNALVARNQRNAERIFPFVGGKELATDPLQRHHRYAINFADLSLDEARQWPDLLAIVATKVKPLRDKLGGYSVAIRRRDYWWQYGTYTPALYRAIDGMDRVVAISQTTTFICFAFIPSRMVFSQKLIVLPVRYSHREFTILQSRLHETWALTLGSTMKDDPVYSPPDCFETYPFPTAFETSIALESAGQAYNAHRAALMVARNEGMTKTYSRFHDPNDTDGDIQRLRELHAAMDRAVLEAYGWHDLTARAEPRFLDEDSEDDHAYQGRLFWPSDFRDEVLARLLALNAARHAEEVRLGVAPGMKGRAGPDEAEDAGDE